jgi:GH15 family glucan-1,4-alpha-glucosidase
MTTPIKSQRYRLPLCPYLLIGNRSILVHLDAFCVPQSLSWPKPGMPDRLAWRDPFDEWPYWEEMSAEAIRMRLPYFEYPDGRRDYLHDATRIEIDYVKNSNVLEGRYLLPGGAKLAITTFVPPGLDVWTRRYTVQGIGKLVLQSEFFEKAVRGHPAAHLGNINFRGAFDADPRGVYVIMSDVELPQNQARVELSVAGKGTWTLFMSIAADLEKAVASGRQAMRKGFETLKEETIAADRAWIAKAKKPTVTHPFLRKHYQRWLLSNLLLTAKDGAMACGPRPFWGLCWPRDCSLQIAGYAVAGCLEEARSVAKWHLDNTPKSGVHEARYFNDGRPMLLDNRPRQGDNPGFLSWAAAFVLERQWDADWAASIKGKLYQLADHLVASRDAETLLPLPEADYREAKIAESITIAVSAFGGLTGVARVAARLGDHARAKKYRARAAEIKRGVEENLWNRKEKYFLLSIKPLQAQSDVSMCWGAYPFGMWNGNEPKCVQGIERIFRDRWNVAAGGVLSGAGTARQSYWQYHTGILLLGAAAIGAKTMEKDILASLEKNISPQGLVPEQVGGASGNLWGCTPLPVAQACLLLYAFRDR